jgi:hypothetical protein
MARSDKRYSIYPSPRALEILGTSSPALNQAIDCWGALLARATADNRKVFSNGEPSEYQVHALLEWGLLTEVLKGKNFDPEFASPGHLIATSIEDAHRLEDTGRKWFDSVLDMEDYENGLQGAVSDFVKRLQELDYVHAWALIVAVQWYWEHHDKIDVRKDAWWTVQFRREHLHAPSKVTPSSRSISSSKPIKKEKGREDVSERSV